MYAQNYQPCSNDLPASWPLRRTKPDTLAACQRVIPHVHRDFLVLVLRQILRGSPFWDGTVRYGWTDDHLHHWELMGAIQLRGEFRRVLERIEANPDQEVWADMRHVFDPERDIDIGWNSVRIYLGQQEVLTAFVEIHPETSDRAWIEALLVATDE